MNNSYLSRLNIWNYEIDGHALSLMANKEPLFENGNVFAWYGIKSKVEASIIFEETPDDLHNSRKHNHFAPTDVHVYVFTSAFRSQWHELKQYNYRVYYI